MMAKTMFMYPADAVHISHTICSGITSEGWPVDQSCHQMCCLQDTGVRPKSELASQAAALKLCSCNVWPGMHGMCRLNDMVKVSAFSGTIASVAMLFPG